MLNILLVYQSNPTGCIQAGDVAWVSLCSILVLLMVPALAFFEAGLLRMKNSLSIFSQVLSGVIVCSMLWNIFGYSLTFGPDHGGVIGDFSHFFLNNINYNTCSSYAPTIPHALYVFFQMMFAVISPLLISGAIAERVKFRVFLLFTILWEIFVYYPLAHWIWGRGGWLQSLGILDFAGGMVIHTSSGISALVFCLMIRKRQKFEKYGGFFPHSNLFMTTTGAILLWIGWFGFNGGSAFASDDVAVSALVSTHLASSASGLVWLLISWYEHKPCVAELLNGCIAGMAGITPASGYISSQYSIFMGAIFGVASHYSAKFIKSKGIDDALDVSSIHGLTGLLGSLCIGFLSNPDIASQNSDKPGIFYGGDGRLLGVQCLGVVIALVYPAFVTWIILLGIKRFMGDLEVSVQEEIAGLDSSEHHKTVYVTRTESTVLNHPAMHSEEISLLPQTLSHRDSVSSSINDFEETAYQPPKPFSQP